MKRSFNFTMAAMAAAAMLVTGCGGNGSGAAGGPASGQEQQGTQGTAQASGQKEQQENGQVSGTQGMVRDDVIVVMGPTSEPEAGFDPAYGWGAGEHVHEPLIQSTLTVTTTDLKIGYDLATGMEASDDGLTWTVTIRDDVVFTDGEKLTAGDVAFTYNTLRDTSSVNDFTMLKEAEAVDDTTVEFHMNRPYSIWPYTMAIVGIVPEHAYGTGYGEHPVG